MWLVVATLLFQMWEKRLKEEQKDTREVVGGRRMIGEGREKKDWKKIKNMRGRGKEAGTGRRANKRELK